MFQGQELFWLLLAVIVVVKLARMYQSQQKLKRIFAALGEIPKEKWSRTTAVIGGFLCEIFCLTRKLPGGGMEFWFLTAVVGDMEVFLTLTQSGEDVASRRLNKVENLTEGGYWVDDGSLDLETLAARLGVQVRPTPEELGEETTAPA